MDNFNENENSVNPVNPVNIEAQNAYIDSLQMNQSTNQDFVQEQAPTSETNSKRSIKKSKKPIFIVLLIIALVVAAVVIVFGKLGSSNSIAGKFFGMLDGNMVKPFTRMADFGSSKDTTKFSMTLDMDEFSKLYGGMETDELGKYTLSAESSKKDDKFGYQVMIKREEDTAIDCQFVVEEEAIGINVEDITDGFITLKLSKEELSKLLNTLNITEEDIKDEYGMTFDEMVDMFKQYESEEVSFDLYKPYLKIITDKFDANIQTENNVKLTIGNEEVTTTKHFVVVDKKMVSEIMLSILETLKEDDETLEFIIQNYEEQYGIKIEKEEFVSSIDEAIENIKEEMAETDEESMDVDSSFIVSIYKNGKDSVAIGLEVKDNYSDEISSEIIYAVLNNSDNSYAELVFKSEGNVVTIYMNVENVSNGYEGDCGLKIASGGYEMKCEFMTFELVETENDTEIIEKYENSNRVLNDMTASELEDLFEEIGENIESYMSSEAVELYP